MDESPQNKPNEGPIGWPDGVLAAIAIVAGVGLYINVLLSAREFMPIYEQMGVALPAPTMYLMKISMNFPMALLLALIPIGLTCVFLFMMKNKAARRIALVAMVLGACLFGALGHAAIKLPMQKLQQGLGS